jgi:hypothetical protein
MLRRNMRDLPGLYSGEQPIDAMACDAGDPPAMSA